MKAKDIEKKMAGEKYLYREMNTQYMFWEDINKRRYETVRKLSPWKVYKTNIPKRWADILEGVSNALVLRPSSASVEGYHLNISYSGGSIQINLKLVPDFIQHELIDIVMPYL